MALRRSGQSSAATGPAATPWHGTSMLPQFGNLAVGDGFQKHSYPFGDHGQRAGRPLRDEGADFRNYTYAKYGSWILAQPGQFAWQVFDDKTVPLLRDEYRIRQVTKVRADTLKELAGKLEGVDARRFLAAHRGVQRGGRHRRAVRPSVKDGKGTRGLAPTRRTGPNHRRRTVPRPTT